MLVTYKKTVLFWSGESLTYLLHVKKCTLSVRRVSPNVCMQNACSMMPLPMNLKRASPACVYHLACILCHVKPIEIIGMNSSKIKQRNIDIMI